MRAPNGTQGIFYFSVGPYTQFLSLARATHSLLAAHMPLLTDNLAWHIENGRLRSLQSELEALRESPINLVFDNDLQLGRVVAVPNTGTSFGRLVVAHPNSRPDARDIVIYLSLPDVLPQVAGAILAVPQPPLSPLARQARQDSIPLAYADDPFGDPRVGSLLGQPVKFVVSEYGWELFAATTEEVDAHYDSLPPPPDQTPIRDLARTAIAALSEIGFDDWPAFGVKAANLGELAELGLPDGTVPSGFAIPIYFYDEFMKAQGFYGRIEQMLGDSGFQASEDTQAQRLTELRTSILAAQSPSWIVEALNAMYAQLPQDRAISYRSSSNAPAWPDFGDARNQDSYVQDPGAIEVDGIDRPMKQLFASHWSFDAFRERELHGIDHLASAVAVLVHASHSDASASGVAVSLDPISDRPGTYYVNAQPGAQWDTQAAVHSVPEALLIDPENGAHILTTSGLLQPGTLLLGEVHLRKLYQYLEVIHDHFEGLYAPAPGQPFAMEIEFTITSENVLALRQARPWVFGEGATEPTTQLATQRATPPVQSAAGGGGGGGGGGPSGPTPSQADFEWTVKHDIEALDGDHGTPTGMWSDDAVLWLLHNGDGADDAVYAYELESGERVETREFELDERNRAPRGIWSDGKENVWVSDSGRDTLFFYDFETGGRRPDADIVLTGPNRDPRGIWSDGETMWVLDERRNAVFAYDLESGALLAEYALDSANGSPRGVWSDGVSLWVSDPGSSPRRLFAYRLPTREEVAAADEGVSLERVRDEDFTHLSSSSNNSPRGIWADGDFMYVADASDGKVYTYNMPDAIDARLAWLTLSDIDFGEFDPGRTDYEGVIAEGVTETVVTAEAVQLRTDVAIDPPDANEDADGYQVALDGITEVAVTVTSADGSREKTYRVVVEPTAAQLELGPTWTSFQWPGADGTAIDQSGVPEEVVVIYAWDETTGRWLGYFPGLEDVPGLNTLTTFSSGVTYWIAAVEAVTWTPGRTETAEE